MEELLIFKELENVMKKKKEKQLLAELEIMKEKLLKEEQDKINEAQEIEKEME